ncbi:Homoserine kinase [Stackebrandtia soli]
MSTVSPARRTYGLFVFDSVVDVLRDFGFVMRGALEDLPRGCDNVNLRVATDRGDAVVRRYSGASVDAIAAELRLVSFLAGQGFPTPGPFRTGAGELLLDKVYPVAVFPFVDGAAPAVLDVSLARRCGELLGWFHVLASGWADERIPVIDRVAVLRESVVVPTCVDDMGVWRDAVSRFLDGRWAELERLGRAPSGPLHHDLHPDNVLVRDGEVVALLDFGELNRGPLLIDVARALFYLAVWHPDRRLPMEAASALLEGYDLVRPLSFAERALVPVAFELSALVDAAEFLSKHALMLGIRSVNECHSWSVFVRNADAVGRLIF